MNRKRPHFMQFGPEMPIVPAGDFSRMALTQEQWADAWSICGPSAAKNMSGRLRGGALELWQVIAAAYLEGLQHGAAMAMETNSDEHNRNLSASPSVRHHDLDDAYGG